MAKFLRYRNIVLPKPSKKPLLFYSFSSYSSDLNTFQCTKQNYCWFNSIKDKALYFLDHCKSLVHLFQIQSYLITSGLFQDPSFSGRLLKLSTNLADDFYFTIMIFRCIDFPDAFCVNRVIKHYSCNTYYKEAVVFFIEMLRGSNFYPNSFTFPPLISACAKMHCLSLGFMCHGQAVKFGVDGVLAVHNSLIHFYSCCGIMDVALKLFVEMPFKDVVSWNTIIEGYANRGEMGVAHKLFDAMSERNVVSWNVMISGYLNFQNPGNALKLFRKMMGLGFKSDDTTAVNVLTACGRSNRLKEGMSVHGLLVKMFMCLSLIVDSAIIHMYSKCGRVDRARAIFDGMPSKNLVSWNVMILGHCIHANPDDGLSLYAEMVDEKNRILPDEVTFIGILCACARKGTLNEGRNYFSQMVDVFHVKPNFAHYWCMANLLASIDQMTEAMDILKNIPTEVFEFPESSSWAGLLGSCRFHGDVILGEEIAKDLIKQDPQNFSYYSLLVNIYAVAGRWEEVKKTKYMMKERGIRRVPGCNLKDLKEIIHNVRLMDKQHQDLQMALGK